MARRTPPAPKRRANLGPEQMKSGLKLLERRQRDLSSFDVEQMNDHNDPNADSLKNRYNDTIAQVFGDDTQEFDLYSIWSFDRAPVYMQMDPVFGGSQGPNVREIREGYKRGIDEALAHIATIRQLFNERLEDFGESPAARITRAFGELDIHPDISAASASLVESGHYANAVEDACKALDKLVQRRSGRADLTGTPLMQTVFSPKNPILKVADLNTQTGQDEQQGTMYLFTGAMLGLRNPRAHTLRVDEPERAIEYIAFLSTLAKIADEASR